MSGTPRWQLVVCVGECGKPCYVPIHYSFSTSLLLTEPQFFFFFFGMATCPVTSIHLPRSPHSWADHVTWFWPMNVIRSLLGRASRRAVIFSVKGNRLCVPCHLLFPFLSHSCLDPICNNLGWNSYLETTRMSWRMAQKDHRRSLITDDTMGPLL